MKCPYCSSENTKVIDSRPVDDGGSIRRRRLCGNCQKRFTTYEKIETIPLNIIKKDKGREMYDRSKLESGILRACYKRPVSTANIQRMIDQIETELYNQEEKEISSKHMWPLTITKIPKHRESWLVCIADKYCSLLETLGLNRYNDETFIKHISGERTKRIRKFVEQNEIKK